MKNISLIQFLKWYSIIFTSLAFLGSIANLIDTTNSSYFWFLVYLSPFLIYQILIFNTIDKKYYEDKTIKE